MRRTAIVLSAMLAIGSPAIPAPDSRPAVRLPSSHTVLTVNAFLRIRAFVLAAGDHVTYCNLYNDNPHYGFARADVFLNPDLHQYNANRDASKCDCNEIVFRTKDGSMRYYHVRLVSTIGGQPFLELLLDANEDELTTIVSDILGELQTKH